MKTISNALFILGYTHPLSENLAFHVALEIGPKSLEFKKIIRLFAEQLKKLYNLEATVNTEFDIYDTRSFLMELSYFLKKIGCPYKKLMKGYKTSCLDSLEDRLLLLNFLSVRLLATRVVPVNNPGENPGSDTETAKKEEPTKEEDLMPVNFTEPPANNTPEKPLSEMEGNLKTTEEEEGGEILDTPSYNEAPTETEGIKPEDSFTETGDEYKSKPEPPVTKLDGTAQSFEDGDGDNKTDGSAGDCNECRGGDGESDGAYGKGPGDSSGDEADGGYDEAVGGQASQASSPSSTPQHHEYQTREMPSTSYDKKPDGHNMTLEELYNFYDSDDHSDYYDSDYSGQERDVRPNSDDDSDFNQGRGDGMGNQNQASGSGDGDSDKPRPNRTRTRQTPRNFKYEGNKTKNHPKKHDDRARRQRPSYCQSGRR